MDRQQHGELDHHRSRTIGQCRRNRDTRGGREQRRRPRRTSDHRQPGLYRHSGSRDRSATGTHARTDAADTDPNAADTDPDANAARADSHSDAARTGPTAGAGPAARRLLREDIRIVRPLPDRHLQRRQQDDFG